MAKKKELRPSLKPKQILRKPIPNAEKNSTSSKKELPKEEQPKEVKKYRATLRLDENLVKKARIYCVEEGTSFNKFIEELIEDFFTEKA